MPPDPAAAPDRLVRTLSRDGGVAVRALVGTALVREAARRHGTSPTATTALGRALQGALLLAADGKGGGSVQIQLKGDGPLGGIVAIGDDAGHARGYVGRPAADPPREGGELDVHTAVGAGVLTVVRHRPDRRPYTGVVQIVTGTVAQDLARYLAESEQVNAALALGVQHDAAGRITAAAGYLVQALPGASDEELDRVEENVRATWAPSELVREGGDAGDLALRLLDGLGARDPQETPVAFHCGCNDDRVLRAVTALGREELRGAADAEETLEVQCQFCGDAYRLGPAEIGSLLADA